MWDFSVLSWFLKMLPDSFLLFVFYAFFFAGIALILASWFVSFIPLINRYRFPTQVIGILAFGFGAYLLGGYGIEMAWRSRVAEMEARVREAEQRSQQVNTVIQEKIIYKNKIIEKKTVEYVDRIKEIAVEVDAKCEVDPRVVDQLNRASENPSKEAK